MLWRMFEGIRYIHVHVYMLEAQTHEEGKAKQHKPNLKAVLYSSKNNELPQLGFEPTNHNTKKTKLWKTGEITLSMNHTCQLHSMGLTENFATIPKPAHAHVHLQYTCTLYVMQLHNIAVARTISLCIHATHVIVQCTCQLVHVCTCMLLVFIT